MKLVLFKTFNRSFGMLFRAVQKTLLVSPVPSAGVHHLVNKKALEESADYAIRNFTHALIFNSRQELWSFVVDRSSILKSRERERVVAEFGVWKGNSINFFAKKCPNARLYGFDSFEGLEEDWYGFTHRKGHFSLDGNLPTVESNVVLRKGWFEDTVPEFVKEITGTQIQILHMDADTYKPTSYVLDSLANHIDSGTIIIFDEYFGYPNYQLHEFKAFKEFVEKFNVKYKYIGYTEEQVAVEIQ
jgi:hypothetical protein